MNAQRIIHIADRTVVPTKGVRVLGREGVGRYVLHESLKVKITAEAEDKYKYTISCVVNPIGTHSLSQTCI